MEHVLLLKGGDLYNIDDLKRLNEIEALQLFSEFISSNILSLSQALRRFAESEEHMLLVTD